MGMGMGEKFRVTLFGESHGKCVGALVEGIPPGTPLDVESLARDLSLRKPGRSKPKCNIPTRCRSRP